MGTKNFSFSLKKAERVPARPRIAALALLVAAFMSNACGSLRTREEIREEEAQSRVDGASRPSAPVTSSPVPSPATLPPASAPPSAPEVALSKDPPRIGVILGPGGMKAYAHVGVLKEMSRARLPVRHVVGLEWGAIVAGLYAIQGQANEAEWKAFKLRDDDVPGSGLLSKAIQRAKIASLGGFLSTAFAGQSIERAEVDFACPSYNVKTGKLGWWSRGPMKDGVAKCVAYPPYYADTDGWLAAPMAIEEASGYLRAKGANLIIYVDALAGGELLSGALIGEHYADYVLWAEARRQASRRQLPGVNVIIRVNTGPHGVTDYGGRRQMMEAGARAAQETINKLAVQYGF